MVLMDYGADYDYYTSDVTRTWPVSGTFTPEQEKMYRTILEARDAVIAVMKPGATVKQMKDAAEEVYKRHGFHQQFLALGRYNGSRGRPEYPNAVLSNRRAWMFN